MKKTITKKYVDLTELFRSHDFLLYNSVEKTKSLISTSNLTELYFDSSKMACMCKAKTKLSYPNLSWLQKYTIETMRYLSRKTFSRHFFYFHSELRLSFLLSFWLCIYEENWSLLLFYHPFPWHQSMNSKKEACFSFHLLYLYVLT